MRILAALTSSPYGLHERFRCTPVLPRVLDRPPLLILHLYTQPLTLLCCFRFAICANDKSFTMGRWWPIFLWLREVGFHALVDGPSPAWRLLRSTYLKKVSDGSDTQGHCHIPLWTQRTCASPLHCPDVEERRQGGRFDALRCFGRSMS